MPGVDLALTDFKAMDRGTAVLAAAGGRADTA